MNSYKYDIFLSYSSEDEESVLQLYNKLLKEFKLFWDRVSIPIGGEIPEHVKNALNKSRYILACYTPNYFASEWVKKELHTVLFIDPLNENNRILPIKLKPCSVPDFYSSYRFIDFTQDFEKALKQLIQFVKTGGNQKVDIESNTKIQVIEGISNKATKNLEYLEDKAILCLEKNIPYSVIFLDIDNFTMINIVHGAEVGNAVIKKLEEIQTDHTVTSKRWINDEFILLCEGYNMDKTIELSRKIMKQVEQKDWTNICSGLYISISIGYAAAHKKESPCGGFFFTLERAILGCRKAKRIGKNIICPGPIYVKGISKEERKERRKGEQRHMRIRHIITSYGDS